MIYDLATALLRPRQALTASYRDHEETIPPRRKGRTIMALFFFAMAFCAIGVFSGLIALNAAPKLNTGSISLTEARMLIIGIYVVGYGGLAIAAYSFVLSFLHMLLAVRDIFKATT